MERVLIETPFSGDLNKTREYSRKCMLDSLRRGEAPFASQLLYGQEGILDNTVPKDRELGITAKLAWSEAAEKLVVYEDNGISTGMQMGIDAAKKREIPIEYRKIL